MRSRALVAAAATALLTLPSIMEAQRAGKPRIGIRIPTAPLPDKQAPRVGQAIQANQMYIRSNASFESYPMFVSFSTDRVGAAADNWGSVGMGQHMDLRVSRWFALTGDATQTLLGGPVQTTSMELGTRFGPRRAERNFVPFVDARYGYITTSQGGSLAFDNGYGPSAQSPAIFFEGGEGWGGSLGGGAELPVSRRFSVLAGVSYARYRMQPHAIAASSLSERYTMRAYRTIVALRFNNVRYLPTPTN